jgi:hypothetical protein
VIEIIQPSRPLHRFLKTVSNAVKYPPPSQSTLPPGKMKKINPFLRFWAVFPKNTCPALTAFPNPEHQEKPGTAGLLFANKLFRTLGKSTWIRLLEGTEVTFFSLQPLVIEAPCKSSSNDMNLVSDDESLPHC